MPNVRLNSILAGPALVIPGSNTEQFEGKNDPGTHWRRFGNTIDLLSGDDLNFKVEETLLVSGIERQAQKMIANCATRVQIPANLFPGWPTPSVWKRSMAPTLGRVISFVDRLDSVWAAIEQFLRPIYDDVGKHEWDHHSVPVDPVASVTWDFYLLALSTKSQSQTFLDPAKALASLDAIERTNLLRTEARLRISRLRALYLLYEKQAELPCFVCVPSPGVSFSARIADMLDDGYLLEASHLRSFFGLRSNAESLRRDLRKLLKFISVNRPWAKGVVTTAEQLAALPPASSSLVDRLFDLIPNLPSDASAPLLINPSDERRKVDAMVIEAYRVPKHYGGRGRGLVIRGGHMT